MGHEDQPSLPDIVVITLDTTRADHLGCYGYFRPTTPKLDALAAESLVFERYIVPMATTLPSHVSLFTMTEPDENGIVANLGAGRRRFVMSAELVPFARHASSLQLATAAFVSAAPLKRRSGIAEGFAEFDEPTGGERRADATTERVLDWLRSSAARRPFLLWVHYFDAHAPYDPPPGFVERFGDEGRVRRELAARGVPEQLTVPEELASRTGMSTDAVLNTTLYDAEIAFMDEQIGRLLATLRARPRWNRTTVVVAGDHGESLGQHGKLGHGEVWHEQLRAPLLIRVPGRAPGRVDSLIATVDVLPTLLGLVPLPGTDAWLAQASGRNALDGSRAGAVALSRTTEKRRVKLGEPILRALTSDRWKYVRGEDGSESLYDLVGDPHEKIDVSADHPEVLAELGQRLTQELAELRKRSAAEGKAIDPEQLEELRALGYVDDEPGAGAAP